MFLLQESKYNATSIKFSLTSSSSDNQQCLTNNQRQESQANQTSTPKHHLANTRLEYIASQLELFWYDDKISQHFYKEMYGY